VISETELTQGRTLLGGSSTVVVISHEKPDGDAVASLLAMAEILRAMHVPHIQVVSIDGVPKAFGFLPHANTVTQDFIGGDADCIITLDCGDLRRTGFAERILALVRKGVPLVNIDHHPKNDLHKIASTNIVDYTAASTTHILYQLCKAWHLPITPVLATQLFTGLYTDSGSFQHAVTTPAVLKIASELMANGARIRDLQKYLVRARSISMLRLWGIVLSRVQVNSMGLAISVVTQDDLKSTDATEDDIAGVVGMLEALDNCRAALLLAEVEHGVIRGSLRSNNSKVNVSRIAQYFGGGGHTRAAGFTFSGRLIMDKHSWNIV